ncbi:MAG: ABC transporter ATP-binding protein [Candidatus Rokubacteria bacterium]|nr:ABC transporter ATP-binding protein [Candidatus Rokubacteria bacterium]
MLTVRDLHAYYGKSHVLQGVSLTVRPGEVVGLLGRNGVGKTTTLKAIMGLITRRGQVVFKSQEVSVLPAHQIPRLGIGYVPQGRHIFPEFTVWENLMVGLVTEKTAPPERLAAIFRNFPVLGERLKQLGGTLSGGEQQMLAIARAAISQPALILMDEPSEGLSPLTRGIVLERIKTIQASGVGILLVEQNVKLALATCQRVYFMEKGVVRQEVEAAELRRDKELVARYLGVEV